MPDHSNTPLNKKQQRLEKKRTAVSRACAFYRANPHRFAKDYMNLNLRLFQKLLLFFMNWATNFLLIAARGLSKTFLIAVFCCIRCILYPGTKICVAGSTRTQGNQVLSKIKDELIKRSDNLAFEIDGEITISQNKGECYFKNGSWIKVVTASDGSRGHRCNILFVDEYVQVDKSMVDKVLEKFLSAERLPGYLDKPEYSDYPRERNKQLYASSAYYKSNWGYKKFKAYLAELVLNDDKKYFTCALPYQIAIREGLLSREQVEDQMSEDDFDEISFSMEMEAMFYGGNSESFFREDVLNNCRRLKPPQMLPPLKDVLAGVAKVPPLEPGERRVLSMDVALMASKRHKNDASAILINRAIPNAKRTSYISNYVYRDSWEGRTASEQGLDIMRLFYRYNCTDLVVDANGVGQAIFDYIILDHYDPEQNITYGALTTIDPKDSMADRCKVKDAIRCIWPVKANMAFNDTINLNLRAALANGRIYLPIDEQTAEFELMENDKRYRKMPSIQKVEYKLPFVQTSALIAELVGLQKDDSNGKIKLKERAGARKDRFSSFVYNNYCVTELSRKLRGVDNSDFDISKTMLFRKPVLRKQ